MRHRLFDELHRATYVREHARIHWIIQIKKEYPEADWIACARIYDSMRETEAFFAQQLVDIAYRTRLRIRRGRYMCPKCTDPNCPDAVFVPEELILATARDLQKYYEGG